MKMITKRGIFLWVIVICFLFGLGFLVYSFATEADEWVMQKYNHNIYSNGTFVGIKYICDRDGEILLTQENGKRTYHEDRSIRRATLHVLGDRNGFISTGIQSNIGADLTNYSLVNGVYDVVHSDGSVVNLTIDSYANAKALDAMDGRKGTVGVFNYKTGEIFCNVSSPTYDVDNIPDDIDTNSDYEGAYLNRLFSGLYTPGSTFKIVVTLCAVENMDDALERTWRCTGSYKPEGGGEIICNATHGRVDLKRAFAQSCNATYAQIAIELGAEKLTETVESLGLTSAITINNIETAAGKFDLTNVSNDQLGWAGIGQYTTQITPVGMLRVVGAIGNGGKAVEMKLIRSVEELGGNPLTDEVLPKEEQIIDPDVADTVKKLMRNNTKTNYGDWRYRGLNLCAKSGTAQVDDVTDHNTAWFAGFMDDDDNPYAFVVVIERGGSGSQNAGPVANTVLQALVKD